MRRQPDLTLHELQRRWIGNIGCVSAWAGFGYRGGGGCGIEKPSAGRTRKRRDLWRREAWREEIAEWIRHVWCFWTKAASPRNDPPLWWAPRPETSVGSGSGRSLAHTDGAGGANLDGMLASMTIESPTDGDVFLAFLEQALGRKVAGPRRRPRQSGRAQGGGSALID